MRKLIGLLLLLATIEAQAQKDSLVGTWYGKEIRSSKAVHWSRKKAEGSRETLRLEAGGRYEYRGLNYADTIRNSGTWKRRGDTLVFHLEQSNSAQYRRYPVASYLIYGLTGQTLIYSNLIAGREYQQVATMPDDAGDYVFTKVEVEPAYEGSNRAVYRSIYRALLPALPPNDPLTSYSCRFLVRKDGSVDWTGFDCSDASIAPLVLQALKGLDRSFLPGIQNGRKVHAYLTISFDY